MFRTPSSYGDLLLCLAIVYATMAFLEVRTDRLERRIDELEQHIRDLEPPIVGQSGRRAG